MACISKLAMSIAYDCNTGLTGIESAIIINKEDIAVVTYADPAIYVSALTLKPGAKAYRKILLREC